jgi:hypothetical protein
VYLSRHKCKKKPKSSDKGIKVEKDDTEDISDDVKEIETDVRKGSGGKRGQTASRESDIIRESHSETVRFISKFIKPGTIKLTKEKDKKIIKDLLKSPVESFKFLDNREINFIKAVLMASTIEELLDYEDENIYNYISSTHLKSLEKKGADIPELTKQIKKAITISSILNQLKEKSINLDNSSIPNWPLYVVKIAVFPALSNPATMIFCASLSNLMDFSLS